MGKRHRIEPGWRYTLAQKALTLIYGRPWHDISPWKRSGVAACVMPFYQGKVLLAERCGGVEHAGCWSAIGGYVELAAHETFAQGAAREFVEETGLHLPPEIFPATPDAAFIAHDQIKHEEAKSTATVGYFYFECAQDLIPHLKLQEETAAFAWFAEEDVQAMIASGKVPPDFTDLHRALAEAFRRLNAGQTFTPLRLKK